MSWKAIDRRTPAHDDSDQPLLDEAMKDKIRSFFPRYPTKRAALLPALHIVQEKYGYLSHRAMRDIAELLEIPPSQVIGTLTFYTHYWTHPRGRKVIMSCRSLSCELMGAREVNQKISETLGIGEHGTTADGAYSFVTEECLGGCEHAPCLLINEKLHKRVKPEDVPALLKDPNNDKLDIPRSDLYDPPREPVAAASGSEDAVIGRTSDVDEMRES